MKKQTEGIDLQIILGEENSELMNRLEDIIKRKMGEEQESDTKI